VSARRLILYFVQIFIAPALILQSDTSIIEHRALADGNQFAMRLQRATLG